MLQQFADWVTYSLFSIQKETRLASSLNFFVYDIFKIFLLLILIIFAVSIIRTYLPPEKIKKILSRKHKFLGNILASLLGIITPFCTCSAIPLFLGFIEAGVPLGITFSFLVASPMINEVALVLLFGLFGWKIALLYLVSGLVIATLSGLVIGWLNLEHLLEKFVLKRKGKKTRVSLQKTDLKERLVYAKDYTLNIFKKVWLFILIGVGLGAWIHGYVPTDFLAQYAGADKWYAVPLAVLIGIPLYSNAAGIIPLVGSLLEKGVALGTVLAFMMAVTGLSLPEFLILRRVMKLRLLLIFAGIVGLGILITGYLFNWLM